MKKHVVFLNLAVIVALLLTVAPVPAMAGKLPQPEIQTSKIESILLDKFTADGQADFIVRFAEQADLSPAYQMAWGPRGEFVYNTLKQTAERSQAKAIKYLDAQGLKHQTFIAGNELYVWAGNLAAANALAALPEVEFIRATRTYYIDPYFSTFKLAEGPTLEELQTPQATTDWGIIDTKADQFWTTFGVKGDGIVVANIDTGVQWNHPALVNQFKCPGQPSNPACWSDPSNICGASGACDNNGHGTHTMGTMVSKDDPGLTYIAGMAPNAQWIACKGCESTSCSNSALIACANWILAPGGNTANRPHIVNNSWGGDGGDAWYQSYVQAWVAAGIFPAFSAGNNTGCSSLGSPGDYQESFGTTGHDVNRNHAFAQGPSATFGHDPYTKPNISAPAVSICSTVPTNGWSCGYSGTSMASPHSAGAAALLWSCNPDLIGQVDLTFQALQNNADAPTPANPTCGVPPDGQGTFEDGYGYLNVLQAGIAVCGGISTGYLNGYVYDAATGDPISGAAVNATPAVGLNRAAINATTDPSGYYTMTLVVGTYDVTASKNGYRPQTVSSVEIITDTITSQNFNLTFLGQWTAGPNLSACFDWYRIDAEYFPATQKVYILGGRSGTTTDGTIKVFDPVAGTCQNTGATMYAPISNYTIVPLNDGTNDLLCTFGGRNASGTMIRTVQCYNPLNNTVTTKADLPTAFDTFLPGGMVVVNNQVYIFGGFRSSASPYTTNVTYRYDPISNTYTQLGNMTLGRGYILAAVVDGIIYAFGGDTYDGTSLIAQNKAEKMDPAVGTWDDAGVADLPMAGDEGRGFGFDSNSPYLYANKIVLATMAQWSGSSAEVILYDVATNTYDTSFPDLLNARRNHAGVFVPIETPNPTDGLPGMWVLGGYCSGGSCGGDNPPYGPSEFFPLAVVAPQPELGIAKDVAPYAMAGKLVTYTIAYSNTGDAPANGALITDALPAEVEYVSSNPSGVYDAVNHVVAWNMDIPTDTLDTIELVAQVISTTAPGATVVNAVELAWGARAFNATASFLVVGAPVASFTSNVVTGCVPLDVQFTDTSTGVPAPDSRLWEFGDGVTSTLPSPLHTFDEPGVYTVTLTVGNGYGTDSTSSTVEVYPLPQADFTWTPQNVYTNTLVQFNDLSTGDVVEWLWDLGDGNMSTLPNPANLYVTTGTFTVTLVVTSNKGCSDAVAHTLTVLEIPPVPVAGFTFTPTEGCPPLEVRFTDASTGLPVEWLWSFGTGDSSTESNPVYTFAEPGSYVVTLVVTNAVGNSDSVTGTVTVLQPPVPDFTFVADQLTVTFTNASSFATGYAWDFGDTFTSTEENPVHVYADAGVYTVTLEAAGSCGPKTIARAVTVTLLPPCQAVSVTSLTSDSPVLLGKPIHFTAVVTGSAPIAYEWDFGGAGVGSGLDTATPVFTYTAVGTYTVVLTATNGCPSQANRSIEVRVNPLYSIYLPLVIRVSP